MNHPNCDSCFRKLYLFAPFKAVKSSMTRVILLSSSEENTVGPTICEALWTPVGRGPILTSAFPLLCLRMGLGWPSSNTQSGIQSSLYEQEEEEYFAAGEQRKNIYFINTNTYNYIIKWWLYDHKNRVFIILSLDTYSYRYWAQEVLPRQRLKIELEFGGSPGDSHA